ncbi:bacterial transcriptional activator domain-containing protein [Glycomyces sp. NPDC047369]
MVRVVLADSLGHPAGRHGLPGRDRSQDRVDLLAQLELTIPVDDPEAAAEPATPPQDEETEPESTESESETEGSTSPSTEPSVEESEASPSPPADADSPLPEEDGVVPAPTQAPESESEAPSSNAADTATTADAESSGTEALPTGIWLTAGTFLALGTGFSLLVFLRRRRTESGPPTDDDRTLTGRLADLDALLEGNDPPESDPDLPLAVNKNRRDSPEVSLLDWASDGLGLDGPGAHAVTRAVIIAAATSGVLVVVTASAAESIGLDPAHAPAHLAVVADLRVALDIAEERIEDPVFDLSAGRIDLPPLLLITEDTHDQQQRLTDVLKHDLIVALVLGDWKPVQLTIAADGTVTAQHPQDADLGRIERCYIADPATLNDALTVTTETEPSSTQEPVPDDEVDAPEAQPESKPVESTSAEHPRAAAEQPRFTVLGTPALTWQGRPIQWRRRRSLLLLAALAASPEGLTLDDLLVTVVGDGHDITKARGHLGTVVSDTRRDVRDTTGLDIRAILHDDQTDRYRLHPDITSDLADFHRERHLAATSATDAERRDHLTQVLACYGGDFATGLDDDWLESTRTELRAAAYTTCLHLAALHRDADDNAAASNVLERATAIDRTRPDAWTALIEVHTVIGDEVGAQKARRGQRLWATGDHNTTSM